MRDKLDAITLKGFKTIRALENFEPRSLTALIGPNGAGKSNFISFFRMLSWALADPDNFPRVRTLRRVAWKVGGFVGKRLI